ncbi:MAG: biliverdin-producing heme oxygenase [Planctomycetota bacterium]|jgi:heme oxygenase|nr:biliverdin-producing heme oxygenase [Planctomycetota bacterium]
MTEIKNNEIERETESNEKAKQSGSGRVDAPTRTEEEVTFAQRLRSETAQAHRFAESTNFIKGILKGVMDLESFGNMQAGMYLVYEALEEELERHRDHPLLGQIYFPVLSRKASLETDLESLYGAHWRSQVRSTPARSEYVDRIHWLGDNDPTLLVAHSYTRYLGDLSGGQVIAKIARRSLNIEGSIGLTFFQFDEIEDGKAFKNEFRNRLSALPLDEDRAQEVIEEAKEAFAFNQRIFEELEGSWIRTLANFLPLGFNRRKRA